MGSRILIFLLLIGLSPVAKGQELFWSASSRGSSANYYTTPIGQNTSGIYVVRAKTSIIKRKFFLERYNSTLGLEISRKVKLRSERYVTCKIINDLFYVITTDYKTESGKLELYATEYNLELQPTGEKLLLAKAEMKNPFDKGDFRVYLSPDKTKLLAYHTEVSDVGHIVVCLNVLNAKTFTDIGYKRIEMQYSPNTYRVGDFKVANNGSIFFVGYASMEAVRRKDDYVMHYLFCYNPIDDELKDFLLGKDGVYTTDVETALDIENNRIVAAAIISNNFSNTSKGIELISITDDDFSLVYNNFLDYSIGLKENIIGKYRASKNQPLTNFRLRKVILRSDGGAVVIAEEFYVTTQTQTQFSPNGTPTTITKSVYNYDDIFIMNVNPTGALAWDYVINKSQSSLNDGGYFSSFVCGIIGNHIKIIFNDRLNGGGDVLEYTINLAGIVTDRILVSSSDYYVDIMPVDSDQLTKNTVLISTKKNKRFSLLKLDYRD